MLMNRFKTETRNLHEQLSTNPYSTGIFNGTITLPQYQKLIELFYGFYAPTEIVLAHQFSTPETATLAFEKRHKLPLLLRDLQVLGLQEEEITKLPHCTNLPTITNPAQALGCLYVLEGSTLGGQLITRHMRGHYGLDEVQGCSFFNCYGGATGSMWKAFSAFAEEQNQTAGVGDIAVATAMTTFEKMKIWLEE